MAKSSCSGADTCPLVIVCTMGECYMERFATIHVVLNLIQSSSDDVVCTLHDINMLPHTSPVGPVIYVSCVAR